MSEPADWALGYSQQANADFRAWELYEQHPEAVAAERHKLLFLQMACEKLCKARLILGGTPVEVLQSSHGYVAKQLPIACYSAAISSEPGNTTGCRRGGIAGRWTKPVAATQFVASRRKPICCGGGDLGNCISA